MSYMQIYALCAFIYASKKFQNIWFLQYIFERL